MTGDRRFLLLGGIVLFLIGVASFLTGETFSRQAFVDRSKEPVTFWLIVVFYLLGGLVLFGLYFTRI